MTRTLRAKRLLAIPLLLLGFTLSEFTHSASLNTVKTDPTTTAADWPNFGGDGRVIALDADSGKPLWEQRDFALSELRNANGAPRVFGGKVIVGHGGGDTEFANLFAAYADLAAE